MNKITMREVFNQLVRECGEQEGKDIFEWYLQAYNLHSIADEAPATIKYEVFGI